MQCLTCSHRIYVTLKLRKIKVQYLSKQSKQLHSILLGEIVYVSYYILLYSIFYYILLYSILFFLFYSILLIFYSILFILPLISYSKRLPTVGKARQVLDQPYSQTHSIQQPYTQYMIQGFAHRSRTDLGRLARFTFLYHQYVDYVQRFQLK